MDQQQPLFETKEIPYSKYNMLWFDDNKKASLESKIIRAAAHYREKYGRAAEICRMNPKDIPDGINCVGLIKLIAVPFVMPNYFLIGDEEILSW